MFKKALLVSILGSTLIAVSPAIQAQAVTKTAASSQGLSEAGLVQRYTSLVGNADNAQVMVAGLRKGTPFTLTAEGTTTTPGTCTGPGGMSCGKPVTTTTVQSTTITPPDGKGMGWGNVDVALALTEAKVGTAPTHTTVKAALETILSKRAAGHGWPKIAKSMDLQLVEKK